MNKSRVSGRRVLAALAFLTAASTSEAADWPQFRGPSGSAVSSETGLPLRWSKTENIRWKADLPGRGVSCPIVAGDRVYITAATYYKERRLILLAFDLASGEKVWERQFAATGSTTCHPSTSMAAPTPVTDGEHVYALFATGDLACFSREGDLVWYRSLVGDYPNITNQVGMAASPILWKDVLLLPLENAGDSFAAGLDKHTGQNLWKVARLRDINWVTPQLFEQGGRTDVIFQTGGDSTGFDPLTGKQRWSYTGGTSSVTTPVLGEGMVYVSGSDLLALKVSADKPTPEVAWKNNKLRTGYATALFYQGRIYALGSTGVLHCADAKTGKYLSGERTVPGPFWAAPIAADGKIFVVNEKGTAAVLQAGDKPTVLATSKIEETIMATPAIADGAVFLRSDQHLYCIGAKKAK